MKLKRSNNIIERMHNKGTLPPKDFEEWDTFADKKNIAFVSSFIVHFFFGR